MLEYLTRWPERVWAVWQAGYYAPVADAANGTTTPNPPMVSWQWPVRTDSTCQRCGAANGARLPACDPRRKAWCWLRKGCYAASFDPETGKRDDNLPKAWTVTVPDLGS